MYLLVLISYFFTYVAALSSPNPNVLTSQINVLQPEYTATKYSSNIKNARINARNIFNTLHSAKRQWGSSVQHNGMSFIPAVVPEGTLLYHGGPDPEQVTGLEWLAFEIQHAEMFAAPRPPRPPRKQDEELLAEEPLMHRVMMRNHMLSAGPRDDLPDPSTWVPGYLHIYRANRRLKLLYMDGMAAGNCDRGTYDSQTYILMENKTTFHDEFKNARSLCDMAAEWEIDGFVRMEIGFEIVYCQFQDGLDLFSAYQTPPTDGPEIIKASTVFETVRESTQRYQGVDPGRLILGYTSMVSAYFYPVNLTNPIPGNEDPRLLFTSPAQLARIKSDLSDKIKDMSTTRIHNIDWQVQVVDMITARYSDRLKHMATGPDHEYFLGILNNLLNLYVDHNATTPRADRIGNCARHYLLPVTARSQQDRYLYAAVESVMTRICSTLFQARDIIIKELGSSLEAKPSATPQQLILDLNAWLDWPDWKFCGKCAANEVCFIAMFPFGTEEDHFFPRCKNESEISNPRRDSKVPDEKRNYWWSMWDPHTKQISSELELDEPREDL